MTHLINPALLYVLAVNFLFSLASCTSPNSILPETDRAKEDLKHQTLPSSRQKKDELDGETGLINQKQAIWSPGDYLLDSKEIAAKAGISNFHKKNEIGHRIKIAVLDNGFAGWQQAIGKTLPPNTKYIEGPVNQPLNTDHGTKVAEIAYSMATGKALVDNTNLVGGPEILLINANGFSNFKHAITTVIDKDVDIVLYAQVWEFGGNFDGQGFINREVERALERGVTWINAAGNYGLSTFQGNIQNGSDSRYLLLPYANRFVRLRVGANNTKVKLVLSWTDFQDSSDYRTSKDLDLIVSDDSGNELAVSKLHQDGEPHTENAGEYSDHARETLELMLDRGLYYLKIENRSHNFSSNDRFRLSADGRGILFLDRTTDNTIMIPADHSQVIAVGATDTIDSASRAESDELPAKPEMLFPSNIMFAHGQRVQGTSAAAAVAAGAFAAALRQGLTKDEAIDFYRNWARQ